MDGGLDQAKGGTPVEEIRMTNHNKQTQTRTIVRIILTVTPPSDPPPPLDFSRIFQFSGLSLIQ